MDWLELSEHFQFWVQMTSVLFVAMLLFAYIGVSIEYVIDYIVRVLGVWGFVSWLGWCAGVALTVMGAWQLLVAVMLSLFSLYETGTLGPYPERLVPQYVVGATLLTVGALLYFSLRGRLARTLDAAQLSADTFNQRREIAYRWLAIWINGSLFSIVGLGFISTITALPPWLAWDRGQPTWIAYVLATVVGIACATIDHVLFKWKSRA